MALLTEDRINTNVNLRVATDEIIAQAKTAQDIDGNIFIRNIIYPGAARYTIPASETPLGHLLITRVDPVYGGRVKNGLVVSTETFEIVLRIIFGVPPGANFQMIGEGVRVAVMRVLQPKLADNPTGFVRNDGQLWQFSQDQMFKTKLSSRVDFADRKQVELAEPLFAVPIMFKIDVTKPGPYYT